MTKFSGQITSGLYIPTPILIEAGLDQDKVEIEVFDHQIRITPSHASVQKGIITANSPFWNCIGFGKTPGINGRDHDAYLYGSE
jgi:hypothetical protein